MEALGDALAPYSDTIAKFAGGLTCLQFLSGIMLMNDIRRKRSSDAYPPEPFLGGVVLTVLSLKLGVIMNDEAMIKVNIFGLIVNIAFVLVFFWFASSESRSKLWSRVGIAATFMMACLAYSNYEDPAKIEVRFGTLITGILIFLVGSPLLHLGDIISKKSTEGLPFPMILSGTIVSAAWTTYGISIKNNVMVYQNMMLLILSAIQLSLFAIFPTTPSGESEATSAPKETTSEISQKPSSSNSRVNLRNQSIKIKKTN